MLMDSFEVENFRSLKHLKLEKLARVNLLVGKNNSGKTSVLEAIYALEGIGTPIWFENTLKARGLSAAESDFTQLFYAFDSKNIIKLSAIYDREMQGKLFSDFKPSIEIKLDITSSEIQREESSWEIFESSQRLMQDEGLVITLKTNDRVEDVNFELIANDNKTFRRFVLREGSVHSLDIARGITNSVMFRARVSFVPSYSPLSSYSSSIEQLKISKSDNELVDVLRQIDPRIERIELVSNGKILFNLGIHFSTLVPANLMGEGIQRLLLIISVITNRK